MAFMLSGRRKKPRTGDEQDDLSVYDNIYSLELPPEERKRLHMTWLALSASFTALFALINIVPTPLCLDRWVGLLCILTLIPMVEYWNGLIRILFNRKEELRFTLYKVTYRRFERSARGVVSLLGLTLLREIYLLRQEPALLAGSALYWAGTAVCMGLVWAAVWLTQRHPARVIRQEASHK